MEITARKIANIPAHKTSCAIVTIAKSRKLSEAAKAIDSAQSGLISAALKHGEISGNAGETLMLHGAADAASARILLVGVGSSAKFDAATARKTSTAIVKALRAGKCKEACLHGTGLGSSDYSLGQFCELLSRDLSLASYVYSETVSKPRPALPLRKLVVNGGDELTVREANKFLNRGQYVGDGMNIARRLGDLPGNICTPTFLASEARQLAKSSAKLSTRILEEKDMLKLGMGALLSVSAGSDQPAKLIQMQYKGAASTQKPYVLVGKGITFDSGGISLKPGAKMDEMKYDMCGAASVFGTLTAIIAMELPINVVALVAASENLPNGRATKPGDVVTSMSGQTIEILNTDAEGRLVLCDTLTYAERFKPAAVVDIATLTGACIVALGSQASAMYSNNDKLAEQLNSAGEISYDRVWRMPLWEEYQRQINTPFADIANVGGPAAGSITAACFLARFTEKYHWAHLDIAGSAWNSAPKGATGRPVAMLTRYLMDRAGIK
ncbi:leucyl aminopeptidase [Halieaceae bacterium IMCC14734]|uniref:Probable cytosol aminopeptidase n=1 Tax=Candidatus Litorirhabdus singularis TaxID=2518993 RepID=A0ABT3TKN6_9GAMM|nr:leucyl aminopeptidase [Candidatus Litorirhabdus singularis]MCX2981917.1 leucyl aminopeptidase [Candidatus Litorirhabdus singularis]